MIALALFVAIAELPAFGTPEFMERMVEAYRTDRPIVLNLLAAARSGDQRNFQKHVSPGATYIENGGAPTQLSVDSIALLAKRCASKDSQGVQLIDGGVEVKIFWACSGQKASPMTRMTIINHKVTHAETGPAVVTVVPLPTPATPGGSN